MESMDSAGIALLLLTLGVFLLPAFLFFPPVAPSRTEALLQTHTKLGLEPGKSRLRDGGKQARRRAAEPQDKGRSIRSLWIYPIKSCRGTEVLETKVGPAGFEFDRLFTLAQLRSPFPVQLDTSDEAKSQHRWELITLRQFPLLATVQADVYVPDIAQRTAGGQASVGGGAPGGAGTALVPDPYLVLRFPWRERGFAGALSWVAAKLARGRAAVPEMEVLLPLRFPAAAEIEARGYEYEELSIFGTTLTALNMEKELPRELQLYLGVSNKLGLFRIDPARLRQAGSCAPSQNEAGYKPVVHFQDEYPVNVQNMSSVRDFGEKVPKDDELKSVDIRRFRPNIIVDGFEPYDEETWKHVKFRPVPTSRRQEAAFHVSSRTPRCKLPNVDPDIGQRHPVQPDKSLRALRNVDPGAPLKGCLGMQLTPLFEQAGPGTNGEDGESWLEIGMSVEVTQRGEHHYRR